MKKLLFFLLISPLLVGAQAFEKGTISGDIDAGIGVYFNTQVKSTYQGNTFEDRSDSAASAYARINAAYGVLDFLNVGIDFRKGKYLEEEGNQDDVDNTFSNINLRVEGLFLNKDKFALFADAGLGKLWLRQWSTGAFNIENKYSGTSMYFGFGFKWFPLENVGINLNYSRNRYNLFLTEQTFGSNQTDLSDYEYQLDVRGGEIALGFSLKF